MIFSAFNENEVRYMQTLHVSNTVTDAIEQSQKAPKTPFNPEHPPTSGIYWVRIQRSRATSILKVRLTVEPTGDLAIETVDGQAQDEDDLITPDDVITHYAEAKRTASWH